MTDSQDKPRKSRGNLYRNHCTTPDAPPYVGVIMVSGDILRRATSQLAESDTDQAPIHAALWPYESSSGIYLSAEISSCFRSRQKKQKPKKSSKPLLFEEFWAEASDEVDPSEFKNDDQR
jgi:hypothetical protein